MKKLEKRKSNRIEICTSWKVKKKIQVNQWQVKKCINKTMKEKKKKINIDIYTICIWIKKYLIDKKKFLGLIYKG